MGVASIDDLVRDSQKYKRIFFFRICGTGMGAAALLLKDHGLSVEGADHIFYPPMSTYLKDMGIPCHEMADLKRDYYKNFDLIVVGNVVPKNSEDAKMIECLGIPFCSFSAAVGAFVLKGREVIGISGTHGKTTTTYFAVQIFEHLGLRPGYLIGGAIEGRASACVGVDKYFFIEADEYDSAYFEKFSKFHNYFLDHLVLTSLELDHVDIFDSVVDIENEFKKLFQSGMKKVFFCNEYDSLKKLDFDSTEKTYVYGEGSSSGPKIIREDQQGTTFRISYENQSYEFSTNLVGTHNIYNLTPVILFSMSEGWSHQDIQMAVENLKFVKRRQQYRGEYKSSIVIDDFAHHPRSVCATIDAMKKKYPHRKIKVIFDPASATARSNIFEKEFEEALCSADANLFVHAKKPTSISWAKNMDGEKMAHNLSKRGTVSSVAYSLCDIQEFIEKNADAQSVILVLSNSSCLGLWESEFVKALS